MQRNKEQQRKLWIAAVEYIKESMYALVIIIPVYVSTNLDLFPALKVTKSLYDKVQLVPTKLKSPLVIMV